MQRAYRLLDKLMFSEYVFCDSNDPIEQRYAVNKAQASLYISLEVLCCVLEQDNLDLVATKPVFGVCGIARLKPDSSATETS